MGEGWPVQQKGEASRGLGVICSLISTHRGCGTTYGGNTNVHRLGDGSVISFCLRTRRSVCQRAEARTLQDDRRARISALTLPSESLAQVTSPPCASVSPRVKRGNRNAALPQGRKERCEAGRIISPQALGTQSRLHRGDSGKDLARGADPGLPGWAQSHYTPFPVVLRGRRDYRSMVREMQR